jgi:hypothetical protein
MIILFNAAKGTDFSKSCNVAGVSLDANLWHKKKSAVPLAQQNIQL